MNTERFYLYLEGSTGNEISYFLLPDCKPVILGRGEECELRFSDSRISRKHCQLIAFHDKNFVEVTDLDSSNGIIVNYRLVKKSHLKPGDYLQIGRLIFKLKCLSDKPLEVSKNLDQFTHNKEELILIEGNEANSDFEDYSKKYDKSAEIDNENPAVNAQSTPLQVDLNLPQSDALSEVRTTDMIPRTDINIGYDPLIGLNIGGCKIIQIKNITPHWRDYVAKDLDMRNLVVLRIMSTEFSSSQDYIKQFKREAYISASLKHPNIMRIKKAGRDNQYYYFIRDFDEVSKLDVMIATEGVLKSKSVVSIGSQLSSALAYAHANNIIHRNINPSNILIDSAGNPMITDFGFASMINKPGSGSTIATVSDITTLLYKSPEMLEKNPQATELSDIYSLCAVLYFSLSGASPFLMLNDVMMGNPQRLEQIVPTVDLQLSSLIHKGLSRNTCDRFRNAQEMMQEFKKLE